MCSGNSFQSLGAATAKARSPLSLSLVFGTVSSNWSADLRDRLGVYGCNNYVR